LKELGWRWGFFCRSFCFERWERVIGS